ncbi:hypothetical protein P4H70_14945 [Paenibacillus ehimensis]|uniref:Ig-like domain-containing protein n=1 Tax=Paenibacillus ehimensis TaxID=79264 RepID=UPI002DBFDE4E|nr:hypothetical protein [Paenibacillus ehimensis]MEC0210233.1 hypothetical protein [Paenibacillus ehimensis]
MNLTKIEKYKKYVENGIYQSSTFEKLADRYSQQEGESISHFDIIINSSRANRIYRDGIAYKCIVDYGRLPKKSAISNNQLVFYREVMTKHVDGIKAGDIVEFAHKPYEERKAHLLLKTIETRDGYDLSIMQACNSELKWVDDDGSIYSTPCLFFSNSRSNFGNKDDKIMAVPDGRRQVIVQKNERTEKIKRDMRFMFGGSVFKVIDFDTVSDDGIVNLNLIDDLFNSATDNKELGIADYYNNVAEYSVTILNGSYVSFEESQTLQLNVEVKNRGVVIDSPALSYSVSDNSIATINESGLISPQKRGHIFAFVTFKNVSAQIEVNITETVTHNYTVEIDGDSSLKVKSSKTYSCIFRRNGEVIPDKSIFSLTSDDGVSPTDLAVIVVQDQLSNTCTIKAGEKTGYIWLHVKNDNQLIKNKIRIQLKPLF